MSDIQKTHDTVTGEELAHMRQAWKEGKESGRREPFDVEQVLARAAARRAE